MAILITTTGETKHVTPGDPETGFDLEELYAMLSCHTVEMAELAEGQDPDGHAAMLMDENGKLESKPTNHIATGIRAATFNLDPEDLIRTGDHIVGDVLLVTQKEFQ